MNSSEHVRVSRTHYSVQSSGGDWIPHTFAGSSSANPSSQSFSYSPIVQPNCGPYFQRTAEPCGTSQGVHQDYQAWLGKQMSGIQAG
jgi:hypothetical protein